MVIIMRVHYEQVVKELEGLSVVVGSVESSGGEWWGLVCWSVMWYFLLLRHEMFES